jgi:hypothetical protein
LRISLFVVLDKTANKSIFLHLCMLCRFLISTSVQTQSQALWLWASVTNWWSKRDNMWWYIFDVVFLEILPMAHCPWKFPFSQSWWPLPLTEKTKNKKNEF